MANDGYHIQISGNSEGLEDALNAGINALNRLNDSFDSFARKASEAGKRASDEFKKSFDMTSSMSDVGAGLEGFFGGILNTMKYLAVGLGGSGGVLTMLTKSALDVGGAFETQMTRVKLVSGATGQELEQLTAKARDMGATLPITASHAAEAMELLAQRGMAANDVMASVEDVANLAISQNVAMAEAADLLGSTMTNFGIAVTDAAKVTDIFNNASNQSALNMSQLAGALRYVAPTAAAVGMKLEETVAAMEILSNAGLTGEMIGTGLSGVLSKVASATDILGVKTKDLSGNMRSFKDIFIELSARGLTLAEATSVFGEHAAKAALNLVKYSDALEENEARLLDVGSTQKMVTEHLGTFENTVNTLSSAIEGVRIEIFEQIKTESKGAVGSIAELVTAFKEWVKESNVASTALKAFVGGLGFEIPDGAGFKEMLKSFDVGALAERIKGFGETLRGIGSAFGGLFDSLKGPIGFILQHLEAFAKLSFWGWIVGKGMQVPAALISIGNAFGALKGAMNLSAATGSLASFFAALNTPINFATLTAGLVSLKAILTGLPAVIATVGTSLATLAMGPVGLLITALGALYVAWGRVEEAWNAAEEAGEKELEVAVNEAKLDRIKDALEKLKTGFEDISTEIKGLNGEEIKPVTDKQAKMKSDFFDGFMQGMEDFNSGLDKADEKLKVTRADIESWGNILYKAVNGNALAMSALDPRIQKIAQSWVDVGKAAKASGDEVQASLKKEQAAIEAQIKKMKEASEAQKEATKKGFAEGISKSIGTLLEKLPEAFNQTFDLLGGKNIDLAVNIQMDEAKKQVDELIKNLSTELNLSEGVVKLGVFNELEKLGKAGNKTAQALAQGFDFSTESVTGFIEKTQDAIDYLAASPAKAIPALKSLMAGIEKINPITGKVTEGFKKAHDTLMELLNANVEKFKNKIQSLQEAIKRGFLDQKSVDDEFERVFKEVQAKVTLDMEPKRGDYDPKTFGSVVAAEIAKAMEDIGGESYGKKAEQELKKIAETFGGDIARALEMQDKARKRAEESERFLPGYNVPQAPQQQKEPQKAEQQDISTAIANALKPATDGIASSFQSVQAKAAQDTAATINPLADLIRSLTAKLGLAQGAIEGNTTALTTVSSLLGNMPTQASQKGDVNVTINQHDFIVQEKKDARRVADMTAGAFRTGLGNAM